MSKTDNSFRERNPFLFVLLIIGAVTVGFYLIVAAFNPLEDLDSFEISSANKIGVVRINGEINAENSEALIAFIGKLRQNKTVAGVLIRINSPGGSFAPSEELYQSLQRLSKEKPTVVSMSDACASGAYYAAAGARYIFALSGSLTGSVGVRSSVFNLQEIMDKIGVRTYSFTSGRLKDTGSPFREMTTEDQTLIKELIQELNTQFLNDVAKARKLTNEQRTRISDGRTLTGKQALELGLVDKLGGMEEALEHLKDMCSLSGKVEMIVGPKKKKAWFSDLVDSLTLLESIVRNGTEFLVKFN